MTTLQEIKSKIEAIQNQKEELTAQLRKDFAPMLMPLFEKSNGLIKSVGWIQYTPYFNDGDECVFSTNFDLDYGLRINGDPIEEQNEPLFGCSLYALKKYGTDDYASWIERYPEDAIKESSKEKDLQLYSIVKEFHDVLSSIDESFYKDLFGDHVEVTIKSDGTVDTNEYNHD